MVKHLYLVRHGETEFNLEGIIQGGGLDSALTEKGHRQAVKLGEYLRSNSFICDYIFASPLGRTMETARLAVSGLGRDIITDDLLKEIDCGDFEGRKIADIDMEKLYRLRVDPKERYPKGESVEDVRQRAEKFIRGLKDYPGESAIIFSHGNFLRSFAAAAAGLSSDFSMKIYIENGALCYLFRSSEHYRISVWNFTGHYAPFPKKIEASG